MSVGIAVSSVNLASRVFGGSRARAGEKVQPPGAATLRRSRLIKAKLLLSRPRGLSSNALSILGSDGSSEAAADRCIDLHQNKRGVAPPVGQPVNF
jgi:hypothetical protein